MEKIINSFKICVTALGVMLTRLLGGWDIWMKALLLFMLLDIVTGLIKARMCKSEKSKSGAIDSTVMWNGGLKKLVTIAIIMVAALADSFLGNGTMLIRTTAAAYYVSCEALSVLENAAACGLPLPKGLKTHWKSLNIPRIIPKTERSKIKMSEQSIQSVIDGYYGPGTYNAIATDEERNAVYRRLTGKTFLPGSADKASGGNSHGGYNNYGANQTLPSGKGSVTDGYSALESLISDNSAGGAQTIRDLYTNEIKRLKELLYGKNAAAQSVYDANAKLLNDSTDKALAETYTAKQNSLRNLAQVLSASGISGGGAESTAMGIENKYANTRGELESERSRGLGELLQSLQKTTNENNQSYFDSAAKAEKEKTERLYNLKKAYDEQILNIKKAMLK